MFMDAVFIEISNKKLLERSRRDSEPRGSRHKQNDISYKQSLCSTIVIFTGFSILTDGVRRSGLQRAKVCTQVQLSLQTAHTYTHACELNSLHPCLM